MRYMEKGWQTCRAYKQRRDGERREREGIRGTRKKVTKVPIKVVEQKEARPGDYAEVYANVDKIEEELGWKARYVDLEESLGTRGNGGRSIRADTTRDYSIFGGVNNTL